MLEKAFNDVYTKFHFYQNVFQRFATREATLTTVESFCMEGIMAMGEPTIAEFSRMMQISTPNAAYKIGSLVRKGYVEKIQSTTDRREYHLRPTQKYIDYYNISYSYLSTVVQRVNKRFPKEDVKKLEQMLTIISNELMPELNLENNPEAPEAPSIRSASQPLVPTAQPLRTCSCCLCPIMPASFFCAVLRWFFSIISHPCCNLPESRGECTSVPLASALKIV